MLFPNLSMAGRLALMATVGLLISLPSVTAVVDSPTTPVRPLKPQLDDADNPYGVTLNYTVAWLNKDQKAFGANLIVTCNKPQPNPTWRIRFQFSSANTKVSNFWGPWNLTPYQSTWYLAAPVPVTDGQPAIAPGDNAPHSYSFNGIYTGDDVNAIYPNGYTLAKDDTENVVVLTSKEAHNVPLSPDIPTVATGEFNRQQRSANNGKSPTSSDSSVASGASESSGSSDYNPTSTPLVGLCVFGGIMAVGLTVVGVAVYRRRQHRKEQMANQAERSLPPGGSKFSEGSYSHQQSITVPEPIAIDNHSPAARSAAGAVVMQEMAVPQQAFAHDYYAGHEEPTSAEMNQGYYDQYGDQQAAEFEMQQHDHQIHVEGLPEYNGGDFNLEVEVIHNTAAANMADATAEHAGTHPQEYYASGTVNYGETQQESGLDPTNGSLPLEYTNEDGVVYANDGTAYAGDGITYDEHSAWPESTYGVGEHGYDENVDYAERMPPAGTEEYATYEATEFEAAEMIDSEHYPSDYQH